MASLLAVQPAIMQDRNCFELYGYDVLLSDDLRPWLLEVNASPALTGTDSEDYRLKFDLIDDVLNVLDFEVQPRQIYKDIFRYLFISDKSYSFVMCVLYIRYIFNRI